ncbi:CoA pyrophosphatase [Ferrimonas gelatinilytica]|uniref:CoA pyrophosphatase n=1 Tax=Ferrimonas gelatinilytica TaxID=1255257 RepID=A0ABP9RUI9_9GAMM
MDRQEFVTRFLLAAPPDPMDQLAAELGNHPQLRDAAVLIGLQEIEGRLHLLLTERTAGLPTHAGQIAFPGGKMDPGDATPWDTALRESWEEIGLRDSQVERLGALPVFHTITRFRIFPQIALITQPFVPVLSEREVARMFYAPLEDFFDHRGRWQLQVRRMQTTQGVYFMPHRVWGATAAMIEQLVRQLGFGAAPPGP